MLRICRLAGCALGMLSATGAAQTPADSFPWHPLSPNAIAGSPDGRFVVVRDPSTQRVSLRETATGRATPLIDSVVRWPEFFWSADSRELLVGYGSTKFIHDIASGSRRPIALTGAVHGWTRAGELLIRNGPALYLVGADGSSGLREVARGVRDAVVTPEGAFLLVQQNRRAPLVLRNLITRAERRLTTLVDAAEYGAAVSRDGRLVAFIARRGQEIGLYVAPLDREQPVAPLKLMDLKSLEVRSDILVAWWLDDGSIAVPSTISALSHLYRVDVDAGSGVARDVPRRITTGNVWDTGPVFSPDGRLAFSRYPDVSVLDLASSDVRTIGEPGNARGWYTPTQVLVDSVVDGRLRIDAIDVARKQRVTLANLQASHRTYAAWSYVPATQDIVYFSADTGVAGGLRRYGLRTRTDRRITSAADVRMILAAPNGRRAVYVTGSQTMLVALDRPDGSPTVLGADADYFPLAWAPDSRRLLCSGPDESLHLVDVDNGSTRRLLPRGDPMLTYSSVFTYSNAAWSPDGSFIVLNGQYVVQAVGRQWSGLTPEAVARRLPR